MTSYGFVDVTRSTRIDIKSGRYIYVFDNDDNLILMLVPFGELKVKRKNDDPNGRGFIDGRSFAYDYRKLTDKIVIKKKDIKDFQVYGTQLMESNVSVSGEKPGVGTVLSEVIFGSSYSILKNISKFALNTSHSINDARVVQLITNKKEDVEFKGITIYYEFNRRYGKIKNKEINKLVENETSKKSGEKVSDNSVTNYIDEIKGLKELLDLGAITEDEYERKKMVLLSLDE
ncbi:SHOCT domain-containing protein [Clostridia bacterium]|nr:SHOCT domain-containing protein [Clostridia bacterium]